MRAAVDYLRSGGYSYSLTPEALGADAIDDLLFKTREGFCGHYSSAFVVLMRAAGVPARVVTGYLGGEWNPIGGYFVVRQSDAHAWTEVWLEGSGWTRVDPTAVVAPDRLRRSLFDLMPESLSARERLLHASWITQLRQRWDAANSWWGENVVKFNFSAQLSLMKRLGVRAPDASTLGVAFVVALGLWLALVAAYAARSARPRRPDALALAYQHLSRKLARVAPPRAPHQGPLSLAATVCDSRPDLAASVEPLLERYARLRYGAHPGGVALAAEIAAFRRAVRQLSLPRRVRPKERP